MTAIPAYGRDYKTKKEVLQAWNDNKDFMLVGIHGNTYVNKSDFEKYGNGEFISIRYNKQMKVVVIK